MKCDRPLPAIGIVIKKKLAERNMSQKMLAEAVGMSELYLTQILRGRRAAARGSKYLGKICKELQIDIESLPEELQVIIYKISA